MTQRMPTPLDTDNGMTRREIELTRKLAIMESEQLLRGEFQGDIKGVREEIAGVKGQLQDVQRNVSSLKEGQVSQQASLERIECSVASLTKSIEQVTHETEEIRTSTAEGVLISKKVTVYKNVWADFKKPVVWIGGPIVVFVWELIKAWAISHGYTFSAIFK